ncbi:MAG TPA: two-component sensor histidine kinase, partial [Flavobacterium sp.]|nr:two-component sensor histidine kinase [Flavobacterium sp.]
WINLLLQKNNEQFKQHVQQVITSVSQKISDREAITFYNNFKRMTDSLGKPPKQSDIKKMFLISENKNTNEIIYYSNTIISQDFDINSTFFDKKADTVSIKSYIAERKTKVYHPNAIDNSIVALKNTPDLSIENKGSLDILDKAQLEISFNDLMAQKSIYDRLSNEDLSSFLKEALHKQEVKTPFEYGVYNNGLATKLKSENFKLDTINTFSTPIFQTIDGKTKYQLYVSFPKKQQYVLSSIFW